MTDEQIDELPVVDSIGVTVCECGKVVLVMVGRDGPVAIAGFTMQQMTEIYGTAMWQYMALNAMGGPQPHDETDHSKLH